MDYKKINDYEIVYMVKDNDDEDSLTILLKKYRPVMVSMVKRYLTTAKKHGLEFDDLLQECYICFYRTIQSFNENHDVLFYTYVCFCMNRHLATVCRNVDSKKNSVLDDSDFDFNLNIFEDKSADVMNICLANDLSNNFVSFLNSFDIMDSSIFELKFNGFSYAEISSLLDVPLKYIQSRLYSLRRSIKDELKKEY